LKNGHSIVASTGSGLERRQAHWVADGTWFLQICHP
jgi:hypothetical protein